MPPAVLEPDSGAVLNFFLGTYRTPPFLLPIYIAAAERYGVPWSVLAAVNEVESDYGYDLGVSSAGAEGWMQFMPAEWSIFGVDANGAGVRDPYSPADAIFAAARYLADAGAAHDLRRAIYAYNHSWSYVESVLLRARLLGATPASMIGGLDAIVDGRPPVEDAGGPTATPVWATPRRGTGTRSPAAGSALPPHVGAPAPPPAATAGAAETGSAATTVVGAHIFARPGAQVLAVQDAEVVTIGRSAKLGRFMQLRDVYGDTYTYAKLGRVRPRRLRKGAWVPSGAVLGYVAGHTPGAGAYLLFEIQPAGAGPIDPRPALEAWRLLNRAQGHPGPGTQPIFGPNAGDGPAYQIALMSKRRLKNRLLTDPALRISSCQRREIAGGQIDRRVLATLDFLIASGLAPRTSALPCDRGGRAVAASRSKQERADAATISALAGAPYRGHSDPGLLAKLAATPLAAVAAGPGPVLDRAQWLRLIDRISRQPQPHVPRRPTSASVTDNPSSPAPAAVSPLALLPLPSGGPSTPATTGQSGAEAGTQTRANTQAGGSTQAVPGATANPPGLGAPIADLAAPLTSTPGVVLNTPGAGGILTGQVALEVEMETTIPPASIASIEFQRSPAEAPETPGRWTKIASGTGTLAFFETTTVPDGLYDLRVLVTDTEGHVREAVLTDRLIDNHESPVFDLEVKPANNLSGAITLEAHRDEEVQSARAIAAVSFEYAVHGSQKWILIERVAGASESYKASLQTDTPATPDGYYDFRVVLEGETHKTFASIPVRGVLIDNTPPEVSKPSPIGSGSPLQEVVTLGATAVDPSPGSGVVSVTFESAPAGSKAWKSLPGGKVTVPSSPGSSMYTHRLHTEIMKNGSYDLRVSAEDAAGNVGDSEETKVEVNNPESAATAPAAVSGVVAPAEDITILGTVAATACPRHETETWAYGITRAPPVEVEGSRLEYTAEGHQLVLLRYAEKNGWEIADVLRQAGGAKPFELLPADKLNIHANGGVRVTGAIAPSGEAWLGLVETQITGVKTVGLFHRPPCGRFEYDKKATEAVGGLLEQLPAELRIGQDPEGHVYGMLTASTPEYALLKEGEWTRETALQRPSGIPSAEPMILRVGDAQGPGEAWGAFTLSKQTQARGVILGHLYAGAWHFPPGGLGLDALDLTGALAGHENFAEPTALKAEPGGTGVWIGATVYNKQEEPIGPVVARYDGKTGGVTNSWCTLSLPNECEGPLGSAAVPDAFFQTGSGPVALSLQKGVVDVYARGQWKSVLAPGHEHENGAAFTGPDEGWLGGTKALGQWLPEHGASLLTPWPLPDRSPLTSVALAPGSQAAVGESGALAVGLGGATLRYDDSTGWQVESAPPRAHHLNLLGVAFAGPSSAFAVGQFGVILHWDGTSWSEDPQSISLTQSQLDAVTFTSTGEGWAVGANGTILHYDGSRWSMEEPPPADSGANITSVAVAGSEALAVVGGNLIRRRPGAGWEDVNQAELPQSPRLTPGRLHVVAALPDGGVVAAGRSVMLVRDAAGDNFEYAEQPLSGIAVALAPFREADGKLRAYVSVAPPVSDLSGEVAGFPPGDGELLRQTENGWQDLSRSQYAADAISGDGAVKSDPVLAIATDQTGQHAWAAGGYDGTEDAAHQGTIEPLSARPAGWRTASIWRYDSNSNAQPPVVASTASSLPAKAGVVSFAFFTSPMCKVQCSAVPDAQPDVNLSAATKQIAAYAAQPGGPAFAMLGGNAVGPLEHENGAEPTADFTRLPELLGPLGGLPTFAAIGSADRPYETPWSEAFAEAPEPFGTAAPTAGITPVSSGSQTSNGDVHRYYAFDAHQNGATLRVVVLDDAEGGLEAGAATTGQRHWLEEQLAVANAQGLPVVVIAATPLQHVKEGESIAALLASSGVLAVFTTSERRLDERHLVPENPSPETPQIPEYEGASLGYQKPQNDGVKWYLVSADTRARTVHVDAVPVIESLALKPLEGLTVARSLTLQFEAIARRPPGTLATIAGHTEELSEPGEPFPGYDNYVEIPAPNCGARPCVQPSYTFASSDPTIGAFVEPSGPGSPLPKLGAGGHPVPSSTSNLFCAYNAGTTTVSITTGLLSYSLPVTVRPGGFGSPCGTVYRPGVGEVIRVKTARAQSGVGGAATPPPPSPAPASSFPAALAAIPPAPAPPPAAPTPPTPAAAPTPPPTPPPTPVEPPLPVPIESVTAPPAILPTATPPVEPIPPGASGYAQSPSAAERKEKARKQASQSAFSIRPAGTSGEEWFYAAVGFATLIALLLSARGLPAGPRPRPALLVRTGAASDRRR